MTMIDLYGWVTEAEKIFQERIGQSLTELYGQNDLMDIAAHGYDSPRQFINRVIEKYNLKAIDKGEG